MVNYPVNTLHTNSRLGYAAITFMFFLFILVYALVSLTPTRVVLAFRINFVSFLSSLIPSKRTA